MAICLVRSQLLHRMILCFTISCLNFQWWKRKTFQDVVRSKLPHKFKFMTFKCIAYNSRLRAWRFDVFSCVKHTLAPAKLGPFHIWQRTESYGSGPTLKFKIYIIHGSWYQSQANTSFLKWTGMFNMGCL